jgi:hypothetical protein
MVVFIWVEQLAEQQEISRLRNNNPAMFVIVPVWIHQVLPVMSNRWVSLASLGVFWIEHPSWIFKKSFP